VLVKEDQLSLAIGRRGQNVRLASKLVGWDIDIMTHDELNVVIEKAEGWFRLIPHIADEMVEALIEDGFLSYEDVTYMEPAQLAEMFGVTEEQAEDMVAFAEEAAEQVEEQKLRQQEIMEEEAARGGVVTSPQEDAKRKFESMFAGSEDSAEQPQAAETEPPAEQAPDQNNA
jgi:N utilization substance protein A